MVEKVEKGSNTLGFSVSGAPIWICKELSREAKKYYNDVYWPVIVDWYRKAKDFENVTRGGLPPVEEPHLDEQVEPSGDKDIKIFGGNKGEKR